MFHVISGEIILGQFMSGRSGYVKNDRLYQVI
jgi:hypothetical protein